MGQVLVVGVWLGVTGAVAAGAGIAALIENIKRSHIRENPNLEAMDGACNAEEYVKKVAQAAADKAKEEAEGEVEVAEEARRIAEEHLRNGIQPIVLPTAEEVAEAKARIQYEDGLFHFAVAGSAGSGKSTLINALRGLANNSDAAADVGVVETTSTIGRYPDLDPSHPFVWYDIPGAGTLSQPDWLYFNNQGLFIFDCIIVLFDNRFTETDAAILTNCRRFRIPTYIVRSKADMHIDNMIKVDMCLEDSDSDDDFDDLGKMKYPPSREDVRDKFIAATRATVEHNLKVANLPDQRVYVISNRTLLKTVKKRRLSEDIIDELDLMKDLLEEARLRRCVEIDASDNN
ncbi:interferon-inducible GTPase-domain-containing protein [Scleroderma yunnanense]